MRVVPILSDLTLSLFALCILITDGLPREAHFVAFSFVLLLVPVSTAASPFHPQEAALLPFTLLLLFAPALGVVVLARDLRRSSDRQTVAC